MKAVVYHRYGPPDVLGLEEVEEPTPGDDEVLVRVRAASINAADRHLMRADPFLVRLMFGGLVTPRIRILGADVAGRVEAVGGSVERLAPGDEVFGDLSQSGFGAFAELARAPEEALAPKPAGTTFEEAAAVPLAGLAALQGLRDEGRIRSGQRVLVNGAAGGVGTFAVQIARWLGAEVTGVCSTRSLDRVRSLGAAHVVDYTREDFTRSGRRYDLILDTAASRPLREIRRALSPEGSYVLVGGSSGRMFQTMVLGPWLSWAGSRRMRFLVSRPDREDLTTLKGLVEDGEVAPVVDRRFGLAEVPEAMRHFEEGHPVGKVVITCAPDVRDR